MNNETKFNMNFNEKDIDNTINKLSSYKIVNYTIKYNNFDFKVTEYLNDINKCIYLIIDAKQSSSLSLYRLLIDKCFNILDCIDYYNEWLRQTADKYNNSFNRLLIKFKNSIELDQLRYLKELKYENKSFE